MIPAWLARGAEMAAGRREPGARELVVRVAILLILFGIALSLDSFRPEGSFAVSGIRFDSASKSAFRITTPVSIARRFDLRMRFLAYADDNGYIVQAGGTSSSTFRLQVEHPGRLVIFFFDVNNVPVTVTTGLALNRWHVLEISGADRGPMDIVLDGVPHHYSFPALEQLQSSAQMGSSDFTARFSSIYVGSGAVPPIPLNGRIEDMSFHATYAKAWPVLLTAVLGICVALCAALLFLPWLRRISIPDFCLAHLVIAGFVVLGAGAGFLLAVLGISDSNWVLLAGIAVGAVVGTNRASQLAVQPLPRRYALILVGALAALVLGALVSLPNWIVSVRMFGPWPVTSMYAAVLVACIAALVVDHAGRQSGEASKKMWFSWIPYPIFLLFALRTDSVFNPINALHWEYVVGPIQTLREGGWLLWDNPSQYGFLNVLLPSVLPIHPSVAAFYWFQAALFFVAAAILYRTLHTRLGVNWLAAAAMVIAFFFLADPILIGPTPYPSMSAVRFLWCYVLAAIAAASFLGEKPSVAKFARYSALPWVAGLFWSAESAIYVTVIFFTPICLSAVWARGSAISMTQRLRNLGALLKLPLLYAIAVFVAIDIAYVIALHHFPDWTMYFAYGILYAGGYGGLPIPPAGPIWAIAAIFVGGGAAIVALRRGYSEGAVYAAATALAMVWVVSSYYVGRAYSVSVTMLSPIFIFGLFMIIRADSISGKRPLQVAVALPLVALGLFSSFWNADGPRVFADLLRPNVNIAAQWPQARPELSTMLAKAGIVTSTPVVYYDPWIAMPRTSSGLYDRAWLPIPLQELDTPIPAEVRARIIDRFVRRNGESGYFVQVVGANVDPAALSDWYGLLSRYYVSKEIERSADYRILKFSLRTAGPTTPT